jgi:uncharacterized damage-inducible protein DinB
MANSPDHDLLEALLDSWERNNTITLNLLRGIPKSDLEIRPMDSSPSIAQLFTHLHYVRLVFVAENAPAFAGDLPQDEWTAEPDPDRLAQMLIDSVSVVRDAVKDRLATGRQMDRHFDHPVLMLQHLIWHDAYHHGQIKLTLKLAGRPLIDDEVGPATWGIWMDKTK